MIVTFPFCFKLKKEKWKKKEWISIFIFGWITAYLHSSLCCPDSTLSGQLHCPGQGPVAILTSTKSTHCRTKSKTMDQGTSVIPANANNTPWSLLEMQMANTVHIPKFDDEGILPGAGQIWTGEEETSLAPCYHRFDVVILLRAIQNVQTPRPECWSPCHLIHTSSRHLGFDFRNYFCLCAFSFF